MEAKTKSEREARRFDLFMAAVLNALLSHDEVPDWTPDEFVQKVASIADACCAEAAKRDAAREGGAA